MNISEAWTIVTALRVRGMYDFEFYSDGDHDFCTARFTGGRMAHGHADIADRVILAAAYDAAPEYFTEPPDMSGVGWAPEDS